MCFFAKVCVTCCNRHFQNTRVIFYSSFCEYSNTGLNLTKTLLFFFNPPSHVNKTIIARGTLDFIEIMTLEIFHFSLTNDYKCLALYAVIAWYNWSQ